MCLSFEGECKLFVISLHRVEATFCWRRPFPSVCLTVRLDPPSEVETASGFWGMENTLYSGLE